MLCHGAEPGPMGLSLGNVPVGINSLTGGGFQNYTGSTDGMYVPLLSYLLQRISRIKAPSPMTPDQALQDCDGSPL